MELNKLIEIAYNNIKSKGFINDYRMLLDSIADATNAKNHLQMDRLTSYCMNTERCKDLMLVNTELSEAIDALRNGDNNHFEEEIADTLIRLFSICGKYNINVENIVLDKMDVNKSRPIMHGKLF